MSHRLSRKQIKRDEVLEGVGHFVEFIRDHARTLLMIIAAAAVAAVAAAGVYSYLQYREAKGHFAGTLEELRAWLPLELPTTGQPCGAYRYSLLCTGPESFEAQARPAHGGVRTFRVSEQARVEGRPAAPENPR